jgi:hypothetical protein
MSSNPMETPEIKPEPHNTAIIEQDQRLSHSMLWELQREFFARQGTVPHYITSNPFIANAYAQKDAHQERSVPCPPIPRAHAC